MLKEKEKTEGRKVALIGEVTPAMPYLYGEDEGPPELFDFILDGPETDYPLFSAPKPSVSVNDHMIGLYVSTLIPDGGTVQIGIGSLGDSICSLF